MKKKGVLSTSWHTERLLIQEATKEDISDLQEVYEAGFINPFVYREENPIKEFIEKRLKNPVLPPGGKKERDKFYTIKKKDEGTVIGYFAIYHGWPAENTLWINELFFHPDAQRKGYGKELIEHFLEMISDLGYEQVQCKALQSNQAGIKFWKSMGFKIIDEPSDDEGVHEITFKKTL